MPATLRSIFTVSRTGLIGEDSIATRNNYAPQVCPCPITLLRDPGNTHKQEFVQFLNIARRSLFEDASMLLVFERLQLLKEAETDQLLWDCDTLSRGITNFSRSL